MRSLHLLAGLGLLVATAVLSPPAHAQKPDGAALVRLLGARAQDAFAPRGAAGIGALVTLPAGARAADLGLGDAAPGIGRLFGSPSRIVAFADAHSDLRVEVVPPLHTLLNTATTYVASNTANMNGMDGSGVMVGVADTGIDVTHPDFIDAQGHTRVAWLIDLSSPPLGLHPDLEQKFGTTNANGVVIAGAVYSAADIDKLRAAGASPQLPQDEVGHGTLVSSCAAGNGSQGQSPYRGIAPQATLVVARVTAPGSDSINNDDLLRGVSFLFDRADAMRQPIVVNLSIGTDFGPHDGTMDWEQTLASYVGPDHPGRGLVVAAGNSGSIVDTPVHQNVFVSPDTTMRVPIVTSGADNGGVQVWVAMHAGASLKVGLDGPDGTWISPVGDEDSGGKNASAYNAAVYNGSQPSNSPVPAASHGAAVVWQGKWPSGTYYVTLSGTGTADLYEQATGDADVPGVRAVGFADGVREATVNLPATNAGIISVGCTINKKSWRSIHGVGLGLAVPVLDGAGESPILSGSPPQLVTRDPVEGEPCWFSSAGPTLTGLQKPDIMAPGAAIVGALSQQALPPASSSIFTNPGCPDKSGTGTDAYCQQIDAMHGVSFGTSFSSPIVAGTIAVMLQRDPTLTQDRIVAALQGGAHPLRGASPFDDQSGIGEVDVVGALTAVDRNNDPKTALPVRSASWLTLGAPQYLADGSTPLQAIVELRAAASGGGEPPPADGFGDGRLAAYALVDGQALPGAVQLLTRRGPGVWVATLQLPAGLGGTSLTVGATFDGSDVVGAKTVPIATDVWNADYPASAMGSCAAGAGVGAGASERAGAGVGAWAVVLGGLFAARRRRA